MTDDWSTRTSQNSDVNSGAAEGRQFLFTSGTRRVTRFKSPVVCHE